MCLQFAANWAHVRGQDWTERVTGWFAGQKLDAWMTRHNVSLPESCVDFWLAEDGDADPGQRLRPCLSGVRRKTVSVALSK